MSFLRFEISQGEKCSGSTISGQLHAEDCPMKCSMSYGGSQDREDIAKMGSN